MHVVARPDGRLVLQTIDVGSGEAGELVAGRLSSPPIAIAMAPGGQAAACVVRVRDKGRAPSLHLHILGKNARADRVVWKQPSPAGVVDLCWTPDGRAVVLAADRPGGAALWLAPAAEGKPRPLVDDRAEIRAPAVSRAGTDVAFLARGARGAPWALHVVSLGDGTRTVAATGLFGVVQAGYEPAWSPAGGELAYVAERCLTAGMAEVRVWDAASRRHRVVARARTGACIAPAWSPDGKRLAFSQLRFGLGPDGPASGGRPADVAVIELASGETRTLAADGLANLMPAWSPDGRLLAFNTCADPGATPHVVRLAGLDGGKARLASDSPAARFLLALAHHDRRDALALRRAAASAATLAEPEMQAFANLELARRYERQSQWQLVARHARTAAQPDTASRPDALRLLATAHLRLGRPADALAAAERLPKTQDAAPRLGLPERLRRGLRQVEEATAELRAGRAAAPLHRLAEAQLGDLGNPRRALEHALGLLSEFPAYPRLPEVGGIVFASYEALGARAATPLALRRVARVVGEGKLSGAQLVLLAEVAAAGGESEAALGWLARLGGQGELALGLAARATAVRMQVAGQLHVKGAWGKAVAEWDRVARSGPGPAAARASLLAGELLAAQGRHAEGAERLAAALRPEADPATQRGVRRALTVARLRRRDPLAYGAARVAELSACGFLESAARLGEQVLSGVPAADPRRRMVGRQLADALDRLVACHLAVGRVGEASATVARWLRVASPRDDLPRALMRLATCQRLGGRREDLIHTLSRLAIEFSDRPEGAEARRQLAVLNAPRPK